MGLLLVQEGGVFFIQEEGVVFLQSGVGSAAAFLLFGLAWLGMMTFMYLMLMKSNMWFKKEKEGGFRSGKKRI